MKIENMWSSITSKANTEGWIEKKLKKPKTINLSQHAKHGTNLKGRDNSYKRN
jgi:hypothetical protein